MNVSTACLFSSMTTSRVTTSVPFGSTSSTFGSTVAGSTPSVDLDVDRVEGAVGTEHLSAVVASERGERGAGEPVRVAERRRAR